MRNISWKPFFYIFLLIHQGLGADSAADLKKSAKDLGKQQAAFAIKQLPLVKAEDFLSEE